MSSVLIVEDDQNLGLTLKEYLTSKQFNVTLAANCKEAQEYFTPQTSIILMDIDLPDGNGIDLAKNLRQKRKDFLLIFLSAQNDPETKYTGLEMGAEDFITKPFDLRELTLRLEKAKKSQQLLENHSPEIKIGSIIIRFQSYELIDANENIINLSQKECGILSLLYKRLNQVVSRDEIINLIWGENAYPTNRTVDNYIVKIRKWIETDKSNQISINTIRGVGYQLEIRK